MPRHGKLDYVEFPAIDLEATKAFFTKAFGWHFIDYGPEYTAFANEGLDGGFFKSTLRSQPEDGAALLVFYSEKLEQSYKKVVQAGGKVSKEIFAFPGGRRFHFVEPSGNEFAVWSDQNT